jgi:CO/xanthine dehydrogenase Mo-binding subunit
MGQNLIGVLAACTAEELGLPFRDVSVLVMDTDLSPDGGPTTASRQTYLSGNAARLAARSMRERMQACWPRSSTSRRMSSPSTKGWRM